MVADPIVSFSEACGLVGALKIRLEGVESAGLDDFGPYLVVGRRRLSDLRIDDPDVSRRHAYFQVVAGRIFCVDLGSRTGLDWDNGRQLVGWVDPSKGVAIGPARLRFEFEGIAEDTSGAEGNLPISRSFRWYDLPEVSLDFIGAGSEHVSWQVSRALVFLGHSSICRVKLPGPDVAGIHAALLRTPSGLWVVDLLGPGGTTVGGKSIRHARLEDGDEIELGGHRIRIRLGRPARPGAGPNLVVMPKGRGTLPETTAAGPSAERGDSGPGWQDLMGSADPTAARLFDEFRRMHQKTTEQFQQAILMMFRMHQDQMDLIREELSRLDRLEEELKALQEGSNRGDRRRTPRAQLRIVSAESTPSRSAGRDSGPPERSVPGDRSPREETSSPPSEVPDTHALIARRMAEIAGERQGLWRKILASLSADGPDRGIL
jgi:pSer/pThr/pTyr-binding forkhead associated (FHA) protein